MDNKEKRFKLIGFINPYCVLPAFVYPVFMHSNQYYFEDGEGYRIKSFLNAGEISRNDQFVPVEDLTDYLIGDKTVYAYQTESNCIKYGSGEIMYDYLTEIYSKNTNKQLSDEIYNVLQKIEADKSNDMKKTLEHNLSATITITGADGVKQGHHLEPTKRHIKIHYPKKSEQIIAAPSKILVKRGEADHRNLDFRYSLSVSKHYRLIAEFYLLYETLVRMSLPSLECIHLYNSNFYSKFFQFLILKHDAVFREEDLFIINQRLTFDNEKLVFSMNRKRSQKALQRAIRSLAKEVERQERINMLLSEIIDGSYRTHVEELHQLDTKLLEEV